MSGFDSYLNYDSENTWKLWNLNLTTKEQEMRVISWNGNIKELYYSWHFEL